MKEKYYDYVLHIDHLRRKHNINVVDLTDSICNERTYRRYLSGETIIPTEKLILLCERLDISYDEFLHSYYKSLEQRTDLTTIHDALDNRNIEVAEFELNRLNKLTNKPRSLKNSIKLFTIKYKHIIGDYSDKVAEDEYIKLINYPTVLQRKYFNFVQLQTLAYLSSLSFTVSDEIHNFLYKKIQDNTLHEIVYAGANNAKILSALYSHTVKKLGIKEHFIQAIELAKETILKSKKHKVYTYLPFLYYSIALCSYELKDINNQKRYSMLCLSSLLSLEDYTTFNTYRNIMFKDFDEDPIIYFSKDYIDETTKK